MKLSTGIIAIVAFLTACSDFKGDKDLTDPDFYTIHNQSDSLIGQFIHLNSDTLHLEYLKRNSGDNKWFIRDEKTTTLISTEDQNTEWTTLDEVELEKYLFLQYADSSQFSEITLGGQNLFFAELLHLKDSLLYSVWFDPNIEGSLSFLPDINGRVVELEVRKESQVLEHWKIQESKSPDPQLLKRKADSLKLAGTSLFPEVYLMNPMKGTPFPPDLYVSVETEDQRSSLPIIPFEIILTRDSNPYFSAIVDSSRAEFFLPLKGLFKLEVKAEGYLSKNISIDLRNHPVNGQVGGYETLLIFTLFEPIQNFPESVLDPPIGKAFYDSLSQSIRFDMDYTEHRQKIIKEAWEKAISRDSSTL